MKLKSLILLFVVAVSFLSQLHIEQIENDFWYYAAIALKNLMLVFLCFIGLHLLRKVKTTSVLLMAYCLINITVYFTNLMLLDVNTLQLGVEFNSNYLAVRNLRWDGVVNLSRTYLMIEILLITQGFWTVGKHISRSIRSWWASVPFHRNCRT